MSEIFEPRPRFAGCPPICTHANLPAFDSPQEAARWSINPIMVKWFCNFCYGWHAWFKTPAPSGGSSNTSREQGIPPHIAALTKGK